MKTKIHYVASTHWDREWYQPFQGFRFRLVKLIDKLIDILETNPEYKYFVFDGQTIALNDYLDIRPEMKERLEALIKSGRILIGPWYTMPDERILSGESLIRNLLRGDKDSAKFAVKSMKYGYICDIFGHIAQMPQIFKGFGIDFALLGRGTNNHTHPANFVWKSPDGSSVITYKLPDDDGYGMAKFLHDATVDNSPEDKNWEKEVLKTATTLFEEEKKRTDLPLQLWLDGVDHVEPSNNIPEALKLIQKNMPDTEIIFSTFPMFAEEIKKYESKLPVFNGEIIDVTKSDVGFYNFLISHCQSSRYPQKKANDECQGLLNDWVEPFYLFADFANSAPAIGFVNLAWEYLLKNHPHDSICGCSIDQVHKDTDYRYDQCKLLGEEVLTDTFKSLLNAEKEENNINLTLFNAYPYKYDTVVTSEIALPDNLEKRQLAGFPDDNIPSFKLFDENNKEVPYQLHDFYLPGKSANIRDEFDFDMNKKCRISFQREFNGMSMENLRVKESKTPVRYLETMKTGSLSGENNFLKISVNSDGTINIIDKSTNNEYKNLLSFEDTGEIGDGWFHVKPVNNKTLFSQGSHTDISVIEDGPFILTFLIEKTIKLPIEMNWQAKKRSDKKKDFTISTEITLKKNSDNIECKVNINNNIKDHRLRAVFETGLKGDDYFAGQPFAVVNRKRGVNTETQNWKEVDVEEKSFCGFVGVNDNKKGLALICGNGLHEVSVKDDKAGTMALTLFRSFKKTVCTEGEVTGELLEPLSFDFKIKTFAGSPDFISFEKEVSKMQCSVKSLQSKNLRISQKNESMFVIEEGNICISTLKKAENGDDIIIRIYNPTSAKLADTIKFNKEIKSITEAGMDEKPIGIAKKIENNQFKCELESYKIKTFKLEF